MSQDIYRRRNQLIRDALEAAHQRVTAAGNDPSKVFAAVSELLFWIVAADDGLRKRHPRSYERWRRNQQHGHLFDGIRYVRNKVAHASGAWDYETKDIYTERYAAYATRYDPWVWARLPRPGTTPNKKVPPVWKRQFAAYNKYLRGKPVVTTTLNAGDLLQDWWKQQGI